jgi:hypothetical protein
MRSAFLRSGFSTTSKMNLSDVLQFLVVCMIISAMKPQTAEWMDEFMRVPIIILKNSMLQKIFKIRGLTLKGVLKNLRDGVRKHMISGKPFGICAFLGGQNPSFTLNDNFFVFFKGLVYQLLKNQEQPQEEVKDEPQVESQVESQVEPQVEPNQCWCDGSSKQCSVCAKRSCYCAGCVGSPCDKFLPAIDFMRKMSYKFLRQISCISIFLSQRFPARLRTPSDFNTPIVLHKLTHANEFELDRKTRSTLLHMSLGIKLTNLLFARFTDSTYGGLRFVKRMEIQLNSRCLLKSLRKGYYEEKHIPWHNGIRGMNLHSFNHVFFNPDYYSFLLSVALNPNPFRWIFDNWKQFARISMSIEGEVQSIIWYSSWRRQRYGFYCQSNFVKEKIVFYRNAILYGSYEENGSFPDFLKRLIRELDLMDPPQDDFKVCIRK